MKNIQLLIVVILTALSGMIGACKAVPESGTMQTNTISDSAITRSVSAKNISNVEGEDKGCMSCHEGIEVINDRMQPYLLLFAEQKYGKGRGYECAICHEGVPSSDNKEESHTGLIPNPSSMWVLHEGKGCAKCHDGKGSITTLMGKPLDEPVGGEIMSGQTALPLTRQVPLAKTILPVSPSRFIHFRRVS